MAACYACPAAAGACVCAPMCVQAVRCGCKGDSICAVRSVVGRSLWCERARQVRSMGDGVEERGTKAPGQVLGLPAAGATPCHSMPLSALLVASKPDPPLSGTTSSTPSVAADFAAPMRGVGVPSTVSHPRLRATSCSKDVDACEHDCAHTCVQPTLIGRGALLSAGASPDELGPPN